MQRKFITFEGPEGSGKSTVMKAVQKALSEKNIDVMATREPGGIKISENIRKIILDVKNTEVDARTEALLFAASRRQHVIEKIRPALAKDQVVLCDRYIDSSLAYQGYGRKLGFDTVLNINQFAIEDLWPDLTIFIDLPPKIGLNRVFDNQDNRHVDRLDLESINFHNRVYEGYLSLIKKYPDRIRVVDGNQKIETVIDEVLTIIDAFF